MTACLLAIAQSDAPPNISGCMRTISERANSQTRHLSGIAVCKRDDHPVDRNFGWSGERISRETGLGLLAVTDDS
jgi:hypothetical protein